MRETIFEFAGGMRAFLALAEAHHARCLEDPELNHPFSHDDVKLDHVQRLGAYWAEVMGGPDDYSRQYGNHAMVLSIHCGNGDLSDLGRRFTECFAAAADDAGLPQDRELRDALAAYMDWAVADVLHLEAQDRSDSGDRALDTPMPHWGWDGLIKPA